MSLKRIPVAVNVNDGIEKGRSEKSGRPFAYGKNKLQFGVFYLIHTRNT